MPDLEEAIESLTRDPSLLATPEFESLRRFMDDFVPQERGRKERAPQEEGADREAVTGKGEDDEEESAPPPSPRLLAAISAADAALAERPSAIWHCRRGEGYLRMGRLEAALGDADAAVAMTGDYPAGHHLRGEVLHRMGRKDDALVSLRRGQSMEANDASRARLDDCVAAREQADREEEEKKKAAKTTQAQQAAASGAAQGGGGGGPSGGLEGLFSNPEVMAAAQKIMQDPGAMQGLFSGQDLGVLFGGGGASRAS